MHRPEARGGQPHNNILARQTDPEGRLTKERLGFDDSAEFPVVWAVKPAICINSYH